MVRNLSDRQLFFRLFPVILVCFVGGALLLASIITNAISFSQTPEQLANEFIENYDQHMREAYAEQGQFRVFNDAINGVFVIPVAKIPDEVSPSIVTTSSGEIHVSGEWEYIVYDFNTFELVSGITIYGLPGDDLYVWHTWEEPSKVPSHLGEVPSFWDSVSGIAFYRIGVDGSHKYPPS